MARRKATPEEIQRLAEHFRAMGAFDPESWAKSQLEEGIPQYPRLVFLRQAWKSIIAEGDTSWIDAQERWEVEGVDEYAVSLDNKPAEEEIQLMEY